MWGGHKEDVLEEEAVQLHELPRHDEDPHRDHTHERRLGVQPLNALPTGGVGG